MNEPLFPADRIRCEFPENLPISGHAGEILDLLAKHNAIIVCGETGSGETTQLPKIALKAGCGRRGRIGCTQPRRIAASSLAGRVAAETGTAGSALIGYKVRFDDSTTKETVIKFMTDGILLAETRNDPLLRQYDCIILDEVHERSLNIDFLLGCMKLILQKRRDLKLIVSSATLEAERMSAFFGGAPVVQVEGRTFPVEDVWLPPEEDSDLPETAASGVEYITNMDPTGDILLFLPGEREIRETADLLRGRGIPQNQLLPLFGRLSREEQQRVFHTSPVRRIVLATNVAETSLTIPGIRYVVDTGLVRLSRFNPRSRIQELHVETISRASAKQRRGRCGRTRDGVCVHLYSEETFRESAEYTQPEIQRSGLAGVILQMASLNLPPLGEFPLPDEPAPALIREGYRSLADIGAVDESTRRITKAGRQLSEMPVDPHLGKMLMNASSQKVLKEMLVICAFLSIQDPAERPFEKAADADSAHRKTASEISDFLGILKLWNAVRKAFAEHHSNQGIRRFAKERYYNYRRLHEWENLVSDLNETLPHPLHERIQEITFDLEHVPYDLLHQCILGGIPRNLACYDPETKLYSDMNGKKFVFFPGSGLARRKSMPRWIFYFSLLETNRVFARISAEARPDWLERVAPQLCTKIYDAAQWDPQTGFVYARERVKAGNLLIHPGRRRHYGAVNPEEARKIFIREGLATGEACTDDTWLRDWSDTVAYLRETELRMRRPDALYSDAAAIEWFEEKLPPQICSVDSVRKDWLLNKKDYAPPEDLICEDAEIPPETDFPDFLKSSGVRFRLNYRFDPGEKNDGLTLIVPEDKLNLLDRFLPDYLVPGLLPQKIEFMLRSLTKTQRQSFMPLREAVARFDGACRNDRIFTGRPLADALAEWLADEYETEVEPADFQDVDFPEYLVMKLAILNNRGAISRTLREYPSDEPLSSALSKSLPAAKKWTLEDCSGWPCDLPETVSVSGKNDTLSYPALKETANGVGTGLFLKRSEALDSHIKGLLKLFAMGNGTLLRQLRNDAVLDPKTQMTFFMDGGSWREDLANTVILESFGRAPETIRTLFDFESAKIQVCEHAYGKLLNRLEMLKNLRKSFETVESSLRKLREGSAARMDIQSHADFLFRKGFLRFAEALPEYPRYVRALGVRAQRAANAPASDDAKGADLKPWITKELLALQLFPEIRSAPGLTEFVLLVEEARINRYAPEIPVKRKTGVPALEKAWAEVKLS